MGAVGPRRTWSERMVPPLKKAASAPRLMRMMSANMPPMLLSAARTVSKRASRGVWAHPRGSSILVPAGGGEGEREGWGENSRITATNTCSTQLLVAGCIGRAGAVAGAGSCPTLHASCGACQLTNDVLIFLHDPRHLGILGLSRSDLHSLPLGHRAVCKAGRGIVVCRAPHVKGLNMSSWQRGGWLHACRGAHGPCSLLCCLRLTAQQQNTPSCSASRHL
jgi:hypothetical protein